MILKLKMFATLAARILDTLVQANLLCRFCVTLIASILDTFMYGLNVPCQNVRLVFSVAWCKHT